MEWTLLAERAKKRHRAGWLHESEVWTLLSISINRITEISRRFTTQHVQVYLRGEFPNW